jgi:osmotically-inducible protein OsmY
MPKERRAMIVKGDTYIKQEVLRELKSSLQADELEVRVAVARGVVTLTGEVSSYASKLAAQEAAHRVLGVFDVANGIRVKAVDDPLYTDTEIAQALRQALESDLPICAPRIKSTVSDGWVTLQGSVDYTHQRDDAERAARSLAGARGVHNRISVSAPKAEPVKVSRVTGTLL